MSNHPVYVLKKSQQQSDSTIRSGKQTNNNSSVLNFNETTVGTNSTVNDDNRSEVSSVGSISSTTTTTLTFSDDSDDSALSFSISKLNEQAVKFYNDLNGEIENCITLDEFKRVIGGRKVIHGKDFQCWPQKPLVICVVLKNRLDLLKYLIEECKYDYTNATKQSSSILHYACYYGHLDIVRYIIQELKMVHTCDEFNIYGENAHETLESGFKEGEFPMDVKEKISTLISDRTNQVVEIVDPKSKLDLKSTNLWREVSFSNPEIKGSVYVSKELNKGNTNNSIPSVPLLPIESFSSGCLLYVTSPLEMKENGPKLPMNSFAFVPSTRFKSDRAFVDFNLENEQISIKTHTGAEQLDFSVKDLFFGKSGKVCLLDSDGTRLYVVLEKSMDYNNSVYCFQIRPQIEYAYDIFLHMNFSIYRLTNEIIRVDDNCKISQQMSTNISQLVTQLDFESQYLINAMNLKNTRALIDRDFIENLSKMLQQPSRSDTTNTQQTYHPAQVELFQKRYEFATRLCSELIFRGDFSMATSVLTKLQKSFQPPPQTSGTTTNETNLSETPRSCIDISSSKRKENMCFIRVVFIDELGNIIPGFPNWVTSNRVFRYFGANNFIKVVYKSKCTTSNNFKLIDIVELYGRKFQLMGGSMNLIKNNSLYYFDISEKSSPAHKMMDVFGTFGSNESMFKIITKQALNFSSTIETIQIKDSEFQIQPDIVSGSATEPKTILSDGIGKISLSKAKEIVKFLGIDYIPTAFQIRYKGYKGMITVYPDWDKNIHLALRESMKKFEGNNEFNKIEVINYTSKKSNAAYMNEQLISILYSMNVNLDKFLRINESNLNHLFGDRDAIQLLVNQYSDVLPRLSTLKQIPTTDPFIHKLCNQLLNNNYCDTKHFNRKCKILIEESVNAYGLLDETGTLKEGEVLVLLGNKTSSFATKNRMLKDKTRVLVCRYPIIGKSEVKVMTARSYPNNNYLNLQPTSCVVVFPNNSKNRCHIPGDLDGDVYFVCWEPSLIPPSIPITNFYHVPHHSETNNHHTSQEKSTSDFHTVMKEIMTNNVGQFSNLLLDIFSKEGLSTNYIEVSTQLKRAIDFPKQGIPPVFPKELLAKLEKREDSPKYSLSTKINSRFKLLKDILSNEPSPSIITMNSSNKMIWEAFQEYTIEMDYLKTIFEMTEVEIVSKKKELFSEISKKYKSKLKNIPDIPTNLGSFSWIHEPTNNTNTTNTNTTKATVATPSPLMDTLSTNLFIQSVQVFQSPNYHQKIISQLKEISNIITDLNQSIQGNNLSFILHLHGSSCFFLRKENTDIDLCMEMLTNSTKNKKIDLSFAKSKSFSFPDRFGKTITLTRIYNLGGKQIDITDYEKSIRKKMYIRRYLSQKPTLYLILAFLMDCFKNNPLNLESKSYQFMWHVIYHCLDCGYLIFEQPPTMDETREEAKKPDIDFIDEIFKIINSNTNDNNFEKELGIVTSFIDKISKLDKFFVKESLYDKGYTGGQRDLVFNLARVLNGFMPTDLVLPYSFKKFDYLYGELYAGNTKKVEEIKDIFNRFTIRHTKKLEKMLEQGIENGTAFYLPRSEDIMLLSENLALFKRIVEHNYSHQNRYPRETAKQNNIDYYLSACIYGSVELVEYFLKEFPCEINDRGSYGDTALHYACTYFNYPVAEYLIKVKKLDPFLVNQNNQNPFYFLLDKLEMFTSILSPNRRSEIAKMFYKLLIDNRTNQYLNQLKGKIVDDKEIEHKDFDTYYVPNLDGNDLFHSFLCAAKSIHLTNINACTYDFSEVMRLRMLIVKHISKPNFLTLFENYLTTSTITTTNPTTTTTTNYLNNHNVNKNFEIFSKDQHSKKIQEYKEYILNPLNPGGYMELFALAQIFKVDILLYTSPQHLEHIRILSSLEASSPNSKFIRLMHHENKYYYLLEKKKSNNNTSNTKNKHNTSSPKVKKDRPKENRVISPSVNNTK